MKSSNNLSFVKTFKHDFRLGVLSQKYMFLPILLLAVYACFMLLKEVETDPTVADLTPNFLNYFVYYFKGAEVIDAFAINRKIFIPALYLLPNIYVSLLIARQTEKDFKNSSTQVAVRTSKFNWWFSKFLLSLLIAVIYFAILIAVFFAFSLFNSSIADNVINHEISRVAFKGVTKLQFFVALVITPLLTVMALNAISLLISVVSKPFIALIVNIVVLVVSMYFSSSVFIGNYLMLMRLNISSGGVINPNFGIFINLSIITVAFFIGTIYVKKKDFLL